MSTISFLPSCHPHSAGPARSHDVFAVPDLFSRILSYLLLSDLQHAAVVNRRWFSHAATQLYGTLTIARSDDAIARDQRLAPLLTGNTYHFSPYTEHDSLCLPWPLNVLLWEEMDCLNPYPIPGAWDTGAAFKPTRGLLWARDEALGKIRMVRIGSHSKALCERLLKLSLVFKYYRKARLSRVELELGKTDNPMCCSLVQALRPRTLHVHRTDATQNDGTHVSGKTADTSRMGVGLLDKLFIQPPLLEAEALGKRSGFGRLIVLLLPLQPPSHDIGKSPISIFDSLASRRYAAQIKALMAVSWDRLVVVSDNFNDPLTLLPNTPAMRARLQAAEWMENAIRRQIGDVMRGGVRTIPYTGPEVELMSIAAYRRSGMYEAEEDDVLSQHSKEAVEAAEPASTIVVTEVEQGEAEEGMVVE